MHHAAGEDELMAYYHRLLDHFGPQHWWPGDSPWEIAVGAVLTQNTNWRNVERAIANLKQANALSPQAFRTMPESTLAELIVPAGYYRVKARRLKALTDWWLAEADGVAAADQAAMPHHREQLLRVHGVGEETADSILCYAFGLRTFVVDAYTRRVFGRHGIIDANAGYGAIRHRFHAALPDDWQVYNAFHALIVAVGKAFCRPRSPRCATCPLRHHPPTASPP